MKQSEISKRALERVGAVPKMRSEGMTYRQIGAVLGISGNRAWQLDPAANEARQKRRMTTDRDA